MNLSVVLLCHNELENLPEVISQVISALVRMSADDSFVATEIIVVDDGSEDGTQAWVAAQDFNLPVRVVRHETRQGYGAAVRSGLSAASGDLVAYMDGDGQFEALQLLDMKLLLETQGAGMVAGIRSERRDNLYRRLVGWTYNAAVRTALNISYEDVDCGFKLFTRNALNHLNLQLDGNLLGAEIFSQLDTAGVTIVQMPVRHHPRRHGKAKGVDGYALWGTAKDLWKSATSRIRD